MQIKQNIVPQEKWQLKCPYTMIPIGICVHNTANDAAAKGEISYMVNNANQTSFHLAVDDIEIWQGLPLNRNGWHAGDGANGDGNRRYIAIEICYSKSGGPKFTKAEENAAELIAQLLNERQWGIEKVKKHQDFSGKYCPHRTLDMGWDRFLNLIQNNLGGSMSNDTIIGKSAQRDEVVNNYQYSIGTAEPNSLLVEVRKTVAYARTTGNSEGKQELVEKIVKDCNLPTTITNDVLLIDNIKTLINQQQNNNNQNGNTPIKLPNSIELENGTKATINGLTLSTTGEAVANYQIVR